MAWVAVKNIQPKELQDHITKLLYGTYGKAEKFKKQIESNKLPNGIKVKCVIHESMIEIDC